MLGFILSSSLWRSCVSDKQTFLHCRADEEASAQFTGVFATHASACCVQTERFVLCNLSLSLAPSRLLLQREQVQILCYCTSSFQVPVLDSSSFFYTLNFYSLHVETNIRTFCSLHLKTGSLRLIGRF